jgi:hypothetical protein
MECEPLPQQQQQVAAPAAAVVAVQPIPQQPSPQQQQQRGVAVGSRLAGAMHALAATERAAALAAFVSSLSAGEAHVLALALTAAHPQAAAAAPQQECTASSMG